MQILAGNRISQDMQLRYAFAGRHVGQCPQTGITDLNSPSSIAGDRQSCENNRNVGILRFTAQPNEPLQDYCVGSRGLGLIRHREPMGELDEEVQIPNGIYILVRFREPLPAWRST